MLVSSVKGHAPLQGPESIYAFLTSAFRLHTYPVSHKEVLLINYSDSDPYVMTKFLFFSLTPKSNFYLQSVVCGQLRIMDNLPQHIYYHKEWTLHVWLYTQVSAEFLPFPEPGTNLELCFWQFQCIKGILSTMGTLLVSLLVWHKINIRFSW